ncbi:MAG TPA: SRPBCC family protein [Polyangiaceae bacterium]|nr:SRPBCC family protein [Polyangiaceae bacterium]
MLKKFGIGLAIVVALFLIAVALQPSEFRVERKIDIAASPAVVFPFVSDFHNWNAWSPWEKLDPTMKKTFSGAGQGKGAVYEWQGNDKVGSGRMEITSVRDNEDVIIKLDFIAPFEASNTAEFTLSPKSSGTTVTWAMSGKNGFMSKAFSMFMNMDKMIGGDFEKGLADLKKLAEERAQTGH